MSPELSYGRHAGPAPLSARSAAVVILLYRREGRWRVPVTQRPAALLRHGGQISLPGGTVEPGETSQEAALRELREELGIDTAPQVLGQLNDCYVFASNFVVTPWLSALESEPQWRPDPGEVERVVELPLAALIDPDSIGHLTIERGPLVFRAPCYRHAGACIWGATSVILSELADLVIGLPGPDTPRV
jgi:8-oxo-dGTP pyrophosphatase MutT (NUDIX family)